MKTNVKAQTVEAQTGQQSLHGYISENQNEIKLALELVKNWQEVHRAFASFGLEIKQSGAGLAIKDRHGKHAIKASALSREFSKGNLEKKFGSYMELNANDLKNVKEINRYQARPLQQNPEREGLYEEYKTGLENRKRRLDKIKWEQTAIVYEIRKKWR